MRRTTAGPQAGPTAAAGRGAQADPRPSLAARPDPRDRIAANFRANHSRTFVICLPSPVVRPKVRRTWGGGSGGSIKTRVPRALL